MERRFANSVTRKSRAATAIVWWILVDSGVGKRSAESASSGPKVLVESEQRREGDAISIRSKADFSFIVCRRHPRQVQEGEVGMALDADLLTSLVRLLPSRSLYARCDEAARSAFLATEVLPWR